MYLVARTIRRARKYARRRLDYRRACESARLDARPMPPFSGEWDRRKGDR